MNSEDAPLDLDAIEKEIMDLRVKFAGFGYCSEEFWMVYDSLVGKLLKGAQAAAQQGDDKRNSKFRDMIEDLDDKIPSGYWF